MPDILDERSSLFRSYTDFLGETKQEKERGKQRKKKIERKEENKKTCRVRSDRPKFDDAFRARTVVKKKCMETCQIGVEDVREGLLIFAFYETRRL